MTRGLLVLACWLWLAVPAAATTFYISTTGAVAPIPAGSDARSCMTAQTISTPKATFASGIACMGAGDTLLVREGIYAVSLTNAFVGHSGTSWANKVTVAAYQTETVWLAPTNFANYWVVYFHSNDQQYIEFSGINLDSRGVEGGMRIESDATGNPHHIRFTHAEVLGGPNGVADVSLQEPQAFAVTQSELALTGFNEFRYLTIHGGGESGEHYYGFYINSDNTIVDHCYIYDVRGIALQVYSAYGNHPSPLNVTISNNTITNVHASAADRSSGLIIQSGTGHVVFNNTIYGLESVANGAGIRIYGENQRAFNNTIYGGGGIGIEVRDIATNAYVQNNISYANATNYSNLGLATTCSFNDGFTNDGCSSGSFTTNPDFTNAAGDDFSLKTTSPAKNTGTTIALVAVDTLGTARPQGSGYDIGAYEFVSTIPIVPSPATGTVVVSDTFTDASGTNLVAGHIGEIGGMWAFQVGITNSPIISDANRLRGGAVNVDTFVYASGDPVSAEYDILAPIHTFTSPTDHTFLIWARMQPLVRTGYFLIYNLDAGTLQAWAVIASSYAGPLFTCTVGLANPSDVDILWEIRNVRKAAFYRTSGGGSYTACGFTADNSITGAGKAGLGIYTPSVAATNSTSFHFSSFTVTDVQTAVTPPTPLTDCMICSLRRRHVP